MPDQPNLLVIMSDQHSPHVLGCAGDAIIRTPNLDALASRGVRFERSYCGNPLCVPSRMTFLTGQHSSQINCWSNSSVLSSGVPTFAHSLSVAGYETVHCGRMHFTCADHRHGFEKHLVGDLTPQWPGTRGPDLAPIPMNTTGQSRPAVTTAGPGRSGYQAFDCAVTDGAVEFLKQRGAQSDRPFCLVVGYVLPHCPFICPKDLFEEYHDRVDVPRMPESERASLHPAMKLWREVRGVDDLSDEQVRTARAAYYGLVTMCDAFVGKVLSALEDAGLADDTAVFYTSDHGDMAGEHEMWWKSSFYEGSVNVPLIASWPGRFAAGETVSTPVSLLDLAPTLTELGGAEPLPCAQGQNLGSFLTGSGKPDTWNDAVFAECIGKREEKPSRMIVRWPWKLIHYHGYDDPQLFNLDEDPGETRDLGRDPARADIRKELHAEVLCGWDGQRVFDAVQRELREWRVISQWAGVVQPPDPDHWVEPDGCNVFPEE